MCCRQRVFPDHGVIQVSYGVDEYPAERCALHYNAHSKSTSFIPIICAAASEVKVAVALRISWADSADELVFADVDVDAGAGGVFKGAVDVDDLRVGDIGGQEIRVNVDQAPECI